MKSIGRKLALQISGALLIAMVIFGVIDIYQRKDRDITELEVRETQIVQQLSHIMGDLLNNMYYEPIEYIARSYLVDPHLLSIKLWGAGKVITYVGKTIDTGDIVQISQEDPQYADAVMKQEPILFLEESIGMLEVVFSRKTVKNEVRRAIVNIGRDLVVVITVITLIVLTLVRKNLSTPLKQLASYAQAIGKGNLDVSIPVTHNDEIGYLLTTFNTMTQGLKTFIGQVQRSGIQVTSSATELSATAKEQDAIMTHQMDSMYTVVTSVKEISTISTQLVETMQQVASMSEETAEFACRGQTDVAHMEEAMHRMGPASKSISGRLETINEKAENITNVVTMINKVAEQTNLLSLNASIEAEKAGEYGRGFTVVAREIRRLADQTAVATLDIEWMVREMQSAVAAGVMEMDKFVAEVRHSTEDVEKISMQLAKIIEQVQALTPRFEHVNDTMGQQSENAQKINTAMDNLSEEMQETKGSLSETYSAIGQLNEAARNLQSQVSRFKVSE